ncbi:hypothetical protein AgCh_020711 [Apium graveolens]
MVWRTAQVSRKLLNPLLSSLRLLGSEVVREGWARLDAPTPNKQVAGRDRGTIAREVRTWSNHEGSILSWCWILSFYGFLLCYRGRPQSHNVSNRGGHRETIFHSFVLNFVKNSILSLPRYKQKSRAAPQLYTPFVLRTFVDSELRSRRNRTFDGPALFYVYAPLYPERKMSFAPLGARRSRGSREGKRMSPLLYLARDDKERASSIDE